MGGVFLSDEQEARYGRFAFIDQLIAPAEKVSGTAADEPAARCSSRLANVGRLARHRPGASPGWNVSSVIARS